MTQKFATSKRKDGTKYTHPVSRKKPYAVQRLLTAEEVDAMKIKGTYAENKVENIETKDRYEEIVRKYRIAPINLDDDKNCKLAIQQNIEEFKKEFADEKARKAIKEQLRNYFLQKRTEQQRMKEEEDRKYEEIKRQFEDGTLPISVRRMTYFSSALDMEITENVIIADNYALGQLYGRYAEIPTDLPEGTYTVSVLPAWQRKHNAEEKQKKAFVESKTTGKPVLLKKYSAPCTDGREECSLDIVYEYAMPNGKLQVKREHSY